ncbi:HindVP family restriction endonuclease [Vibrio alginolyticus]|uniref:HindVP family restriction endonuclease n=1 Tax=Vibrio alginolyticus TaxID=663 RepID=UPI001BD1F25E|nr:HindVP family restriction endonuclease [Vibrio alginolyticus]MBS9898122.1 HindVP family restriction endonuclease [Vibrio alginolyticus]
MNKPALFGLTKSNRDFTKKTSWGKNQFNSSFPASLCAYFEHRNLSPNYLTVKNNKLIISTKTVSMIFGLGCKSIDDVFYAFESAYTPYNKYVLGTLPRTDLVIQDYNSGKCLRGLEIKLTALPDQTTFNKKESEYGSEIVIRPDTIVYLACSLIETMEQANVSFDAYKRLDFEALDEPQDAVDLAKDILSNINSIINDCAGTESPVLVQPVWKTQGKSPILSEHCLDVFVWSDIGLAKFIHDIAIPVIKSGKMTRQYRTVVWLYKMLNDYFMNGAFNHKVIIDKLSFNLKNDKAFSSTGAVNNPFMACDNLTKPRISKKEIKNIILNNGQNLLSPERRFDAIICNSPDLFEE